MSTAETFATAEITSACPKATAALAAMDIGADLGACVQSVGTDTPTIGEMTARVVGDMTRNGNVEIG